MYPIITVVDFSVETDSFDSISGIFDNFYPFSMETDRFYSLLVIFEYFDPFSVETDSFDVFLMRRQTYFTILSVDLPLFALLWLDRHFCDDMMSPALDPSFEMTNNGSPRSRQRRQPRRRLRTLDPVVGFTVSGKDTVNQIKIYISATTMANPSSILAGLKSLVGDTGPTTAHGQFIHSTLLPLLTKLQREVRSRKHKVRLETGAAAAAAATTTTTRTTTTTTTNRDTRIRA